MRRLLAVVLCSGLCLVPAPAQQPARPSSQPAQSPAIEVRVDPRVELLSIVFRLAGNPEYSQGRVAS
jgi:hypothetical protein